ncbi:high mobility group box domain-containing protein, partial [Hysterangium stoloniferum]
MSPGTILATLDDIASSGPKKKSHARKQPAGHIPRPRNAFILFRCLFVSQQSVPASIEKDHRNISRIAGRVWKAMSNQEREPWTKAAEIEKNRHEQKWPGYRY